MIYDPTKIHVTLSYDPSTFFVQSQVNHNKIQKFKLNFLEVPVFVPCTRYEILEYQEI